MISKVQCFLIATLTVILTYYFNKHPFQDAGGSAGTHQLAIGVLSSRENFLQRQFIRSTWLNVSEMPYRHLFKSWFIIGKTSCDIPLECKLDKYSCKKWLINVKDAKEKFHSGAMISEATSKTLNVFHQGFSFQVNHPLVVTKLAVAITLLVPNVAISVILRDLQTKEVVVKAAIRISNETKANKSGYIYENVEHYFLPKGYEGLLVVEGHLLHGSYDNTMWNNGSGTISFNRIYTSENDFESVAFSEKLNSAPSVAFTVLDLNELKDIASSCEDRTLEYRQHSQEITEKLITENSKWNDMVFVDVMDTYRNLPKKLLLFYKWLTNNENFYAVLKTDDDCIIDIQKILKRLENQEQFNPEQSWIWSRFRFGWPVNYIGKWAEYEYKSPTYPMFPCGGGYVLSQAVIQWLSKNIHHLFSYQGEDVSLGIWMTAINAQYINDENWECDRNCDENSYNRAQLSTTEMADSWSAKNNCGNICHCHTI